MKYNLKTYTVDERIFQEMEYQCEDIVTKILREMYDTKEQQLINALIKLGWTPPVINNMTDDNLSHR